MSYYIHQIPGRLRIKTVSGAALETAFEGSALSLIAALI